MSWSAGAPGRRGGWRGENPRRRPPPSPPRRGAGRGSPPGPETARHLGALLLVDGVGGAQVLLEIPAEVFQVLRAQQIGQGYGRRGGLGDLTVAGQPHAGGAVLQLDDQAVHRPPFPPSTLTTTPAAGNCRPAAWSGSSPTA